MKLALVALPDNYPFEPLLITSRVLAEVPGAHDTVAARQLLNRLAGEITASLEIKPNTP